LDADLRAVVAAWSKLSERDRGRIVGVVEGARI
jgi:hypothetical protein